MAKRLVEIIRTFFTGESRTVTVKINVFYSVLLRLVSIAVSFLLVPVTIGYVSAELYGVWLTLSSIMGWLSYMDVGFTQGLKNRLTEAIAQEDWDRGKKLVSTTYYMMVLIFVPLCIILVLLSPLIDWCGFLNIDKQYEDEVLRVIIVVFGFACLQMIVNVIVSVVAAFQKVALSNSFSVIGNLLALIVITVLTRVAPPSLFYLSIVFCSLPILVTIIASFILYSGKFKDVAPSFSNIRHGFIRDLFSLGYKFFIINVQGLILYQSANFLISYLSSPLLVTSYNLAYRYLNLAMMLFTIITAPLWPAYTDAFVKSDYKWMKNTRNRMRKVFFLSVLCLVLMVIVSSFVYKIWVRGQAEVPFIMTLVVAVYVICYCWQNLNGIIIVGIGKLKLTARLVWIGMLCHIPVSLLLGQYLGAYGVIISMILITAIYAIVFHIQVNKLLCNRANGIWNE